MKSYFLYEKVIVDDFSIENFIVNDFFYKTVIADDFSIRNGNR